MIPANIFVFLTAFTYVLHAVMVKYASGKIDPYTGIFIWSCGAFIIGSMSFLYGRVNGETLVSFPGAIYLLLAGGGITIGSLCYLFAFQRGVDFSFATPLVNISVVMGGLVFGLLLFGETLSISRIAGMLFGILSIILLLRS